jgi:tetratricopeptide (TPR) repeat protein
MQPIPERLSLAQRHHQAGRLDEAEALYRGVLVEAPNHPHALHLLGVMAHQRGQHQQARELIQQAIAAHGPHPVFFSNLAAACLALGRLQDAEAYCHTALRLNPDMADAYANLAIILERRGEHAEAQRCRDRAEHLRAGGDDLLRRLERAVQSDPTNAEKHNELGMLYLERGLPDRAAPYLREAVRLRPDWATARTNLGAALVGISRHEEAVQCFVEAVRLAPQLAPARSNLGAAYVQQGKIAAARAELEVAIRLDPNNAQTIFALSELAAAGDYTFSDAELNRVRELADRPGLTLQDKSHLHFALAQVLDGRRQYDEAFEHARQANLARQAVDQRRGIGFDPAVHADYVDRLIATCTPAFFERVREIGVGSELPIFIVGMMRSGTTLAEQILVSHPAVAGAGELPHMGLYAGALPRRLGGKSPYPECLTQLDASTAHAIAGEYLQVVEEHRGTRARVVDKMPLNFLGVGFIATLFPKARIIHCRRDPLDTCVSCYFRNFSTTFPFKTDLEQLGKVYRDYERLMAHWRAVLPMPIFELHYEELTAETESLTRRLVEFCGLEWDDRCLRFHETQRPVRTASMLQVRKPIYRSAIGRWKRYEQQLAPLIAVFGR